MVPTLRRLGMIETLGNPQFRLLREPFERSCRSLGIEPVFVEISTPGEIDGAIESLARQRIQALVLVEDSFGLRHGSQIISAALRLRVPTVGGDPDWVRRDGALASYSVTEAEVDRRTAYYVNRILRGARPADLPVEQPTQFELVINLKTARALGLAVPQALLLQADEVVR